MGNKIKTFEESKIEKKDVFVKFAQWLSLPNPERKAMGITTQKEFAKIHEVTEDTLSIWKKRPDLWPLVEKHSIAWGREKMSNVLGGLYTRALKGYAAEVELWLAYVMKWDKKQILEYKGTLELTDNDIFKLIETLPEDKQKYFNDAFTKLLAEAITERDTGGDEEANSDGHSDNKKNVQPPANNISKDIQPKDKVANEAKADIR